MHYARRFPHARTTGLESDIPSIGLAHRALADAGLSDRVEIREVDANNLEDENVFDLVTLNVTLHEIGGRL